MDYIDLRSDTVSFPTPEMKEAMMAAELGDDVYGEDPTVNALEAEAAARFGKEAGLFVTSGTQGNLVSLLAHCSQRGDEMIVGDVAHTLNIEAGGVSAVGGIMTRPIPVMADGSLNPDDVRAAIREQDIHLPRTKLIAMENTVNARSGAPVGKAAIDAITTIAQAHRIKTHIDGARIFNAEAALGTPVADLCEHVDSITFCLSKGLCAPAGSVVVGDKAFIDEARRYRKMLGGGMRQAGMLAAAGRVALEKMTGRLSEDHQNACYLAEGLATIEALDVDVANVKTNFVYIWLREDAPLDIAEFTERLWKDYRIRVSPYRDGGRKFRLVTHYWITPERVQQTVEAMRELLA